MTLAETGQVYVTLRAAREYAKAMARDDRERADWVELEHDRRELTTLLLDARRRQTDAPPYERWRFRRGSLGIEISALVSREGPLAVVVTVEVHRRIDAQANE